MVLTELYRSSSRSQSITSADTSTGFFPMI
nr:MAG TPA: hypothetical protein [Caudoviricetes sp.]